ncbi:MAG: DUF6318 family protein [Kineosporiaceae bacterium]
MRTRGAALLALVAAGLTAACSGEQPGPGPSPTVSDSSESVSPTPTPTWTPPPTRPAAALEGTPAGAEAFVRYFLEVYVYAFASNNPSPLDDVTLKGCGFCVSLTDEIRAHAAKGHRVVGETLQVTSVVAAPNGSQDRTVVSALFHQSASKLVDSAGKTVDSFDSAPSQELAIAVRWNVVTGWRVIAGRFEDHDK